MKEHSVTEHDSDEFAELRLQTMNDTISKYSDKNVIIIVILKKKKKFKTRCQYTSVY